MNTKALIVEHLFKKYSKESYYANNDISCVFKSGTIPTLVDHNGAGKTTLLHQIIGLSKTDSGTIHYSDISLTDNPHLA